MSHDTEARLTELESKIAFLEASNQELSDVIYNQQKLIDQLKAHITREVSRLELSSASADGVDEIPPHY